MCLVLPIKVTNFHSCHSFSSLGHFSDHSLVCVQIVDLQKLVSHNCVQVLAVAKKVGFSNLLLEIVLFDLETK